MRELGLPGAVARPQAPHHDRRPMSPTGRVIWSSAVRGDGTEPAVGRRHHLRRDLVRVRLRRVRHRRVLPADRRLAGIDHRCAPTSPWTRWRWRSGPAAQRRPRRAGPPLRPRRPILVDPLHRTPRRRRRRRLGRVTRRLLRQRHGRVDQRALQGRADHQARTMARRRRRRARHPRLGRLVQQPPAPRARSATSHPSNSSTTGRPHNRPTKLAITTPPMASSHNHEVSTRPGAHQFGTLLIRSFRHRVTGRCRGPLTPRSR